MRSTVNALSDRLLNRFVPKAKAGACACGPWDSGWEHWCQVGQFGPTRWEAYCTYNCNCVPYCTNTHDTYQGC